MFCVCLLAYKPGTHKHLCEVVVVFIVNGKPCCVSVVSKIYRQPVQTGVTFVDQLDCPLGKSVCEEKEWRTGKQLSLLKLIVKLMCANCLALLFCVLTVPK